MKRLIKKALFFVALVICAVIITIYIQVEKLDFNIVPKNNLSNAACFRAKLDKIIDNEHFQECTFIISGSSMSLNNIAGTILENKTHEQVYNLSAWSTKPEQTIRFFKSGLLKHHIKYLLIGFNNVDFGKSQFTINYNDLWLISTENIIARYWVFIKTFNINTFCNDWNYRNQYSNRRNDYQSLCFDKTGSIQLENKNFKINNYRWTLNYDTTGFSIFYNQVTLLNQVCIDKNIALILVYLPTRSDLVSEKKRRQNLAVSTRLKNKFGSNFINLNKVTLPISSYCDGTHLFKEGAEKLTLMITDSLEMNQGHKQ